MHCNSNLLNLISPTTQPITPILNTSSFHHQSQLSFTTHLNKSTFPLLKTSYGFHSHPNRSRSTAAAAAVLVAETETESFYELLGISESVTQNEIKVAYKQMALKYHPDVSSPERKDEHTRKFIRVQEAYETLSDPGTRAEYDCGMGKGVFAGRRGIRFDEEREGWKNRWQSQIMGLKKRSMRSESKVGRMDSSSMSWGERIRKRRSEAHGSSE